jgi:hypothetical protein
MFNRSRALLLGSALAVTVAGVAAVAPSAASAAGSCHSGTTKYSVYWKKPGQASVWFTGLSNPNYCMRIRAHVESNIGLWYNSGLIDQSPPTATAHVASAANGDGSGVQVAWEQRDWHDGSHKAERELYPLPGGWINGWSH